MDTTHWMQHIGSSQWRQLGSLDHHIGGNTVMENWKAKTTRQTQKIRVGQNRIYTLHTIVYKVIFLPKVTCIHRTYTYI